MFAPDDIFRIDTDAAFERAALETFRFQAGRCAPYREYLDRIGVRPAQVGSLREIPFLPIRLFKSREVYCGDRAPEAVFTSSATTGMTPSRHPMQSLAWYERTFRAAFRTFYGDPARWSLYGLLPSYLEREGSSLVYMADRLIGDCGSGGFYLDDYERLLDDMRADPKPKILLGVSYALWDLAERHAPKLRDTIVMETGGMKGHRRELPKEEFHRLLCGAFLAFFATLEGLFFAANLFKFAHGGWYSLLIAAVVAAVMIIWRNATRVRARFIEYRSLADCAPLIADVKADMQIPRYASNIIYFSRSPDKALVESKLVYSIISKQPKRADHYWLLRIEHTDDPDTLSYTTDVVVPGTLYLVTMRLGFRVQPTVSVYLRQVVEDLVAAGRLDLTSTYPSLHARGIPGDFRFIILHRIFSPSSSCPRGAARLMRLHGMLRRMGVSDQSAMGLDTSAVTLETVPLIINTSPQRRIVKTD